MDDQLGRRVVSCESQSWKVFEQGNCVIFISSVGREYGKTASGRCGDCST